MNQAQRKEQIQNWALAAGIGTFFIVLLGFIYFDTGESNCRESARVIESAQRCTDRSDCSLTMTDIEKLIGREKHFARQCGETE